MTSPPEPDPPPFPPHEVERREQIYDSPWVGLRRDHLLLPGGRRQEYHVVQITDAVVVVPRLRDGRLMLIWQHRHPNERSHWEVPAGRIHAGEAPEAAAHRELREETGQRAGCLVPLPGFFPINGISDHYAHAFLALDCEQAGEPELDATERLLPRAFSEEHVRGMLAAGTFADGFTALPLFYAFAHLDRADVGA